MHDSPTLSRACLNSNKKTPNISDVLSPKVWETENLRCARHFSRLDSFESTVRFYTRCTCSIQMKLTFSRCILFKYSKGYGVGMWNSSMTHSIVRLPKSYGMVVTSCSKYHFFVAILFIAHRCS